MYMYSHCIVDGAATRIMLALQPRGVVCGIKNLLTATKLAMSNYMYLYTEAEKESSETSWKYGRRLGHVHLQHEGISSVYTYYTAVYMHTGVLDDSELDRTYI